MAVDSKLARLSFDNLTNWVTRSRECLGRPSNYSTSSKENLDRDVLRPPSFFLLQSILAIPSRGYYVRLRSTGGSQKIPTTCHAHYPASCQAAAHYPANCQATSPYSADCQEAAHYPNLPSVRRRPTTLPAARWQLATLSATPAATRYSYKSIRGTPTQEVTHLPFHSRSGPQLGLSYHTSTPPLPPTHHGRQLSAVARIPPFCISTDLSIGVSLLVSPI